MISKLSEKITEYAVNSGNINSGQYDEYSYAINMILNILITDITMLVIGLAMGMLWESIVFWLIYKLLRKYCGGFHFSTSLKCYLSSCVMCPIVLLAIREIPNGIDSLGAVTLLSLALLFVLSPVAAINKPLDDKEEVVFGRIAKALTVSTALFWLIISVIFHEQELSKVVSLSVISVTAYAIAGKISWLKQHNEEQISHLRLTKSSLQPKPKKKK